ncbi:MAG TPA: DNA polymerase Y family protein [Pirellulales bacterium]|jgi:protein ImuB|nr:DNA polymerase Y family protein [Pirellulales bacterium]
MKRVLCVRLPDWPRQRHGVVRRELELSDREALASLVPWCEHFSPSVGVDTTEPLESLFLDVTGLAGLFHGEESLVEHVQREFGRRGLTTRAVLADTPGAAWGLARYGKMAQPSLVVPPGQTLAELSPLPVEALRLNSDCVETLKDLGLRRVGQLLPFSRESLAARFGPELLLRLDQASGAVEEVIVADHPEPTVEAEWIFEHPTDREEVIRQVFQRQLEQITRELAPRRQGVQELVCRWRGETGTSGEITVGLYRASASPRHLAELIDVQWEAARRKLAEPLASVSISVTAAAALECRQQELFERRYEGDAPYDPRQTALLIDRLSSRLGRSSVVRARLLPEAQPELAWRYEPLVGGPKRRSNRPRDVLRGVRVRQPGKKRSASKDSLFRPWPLVRPLSLAVRPLGVEVVSMATHGSPLAFVFLDQQHRVQRTWGPERIQTGWWRGRSVRRDYYRVETTAGRWFWLFRQLTDNRWYLHGTFD